MENKYFPIHVAPSCKLKWSWNTLRLYTGGTSSCHRVTSDVVSVEDFETFHNTPKKLADRQLMLDGQWPTGGCEYCQRVEETGGFSDRQFHLKIPNQYPLELDADPTLTNVNPTILEVYLDNVCNMSCLYCWDGFSSKIQQENSKFGVFDSKGVTIANRAVKHPQHEQLKNKFWDWMQDHSQTLSRLHILGGEPFYQKDFETCLAFLEAKSHSELEFNVVSNLMIDPIKFKNIIDRIHQLAVQNKIKRFDLTVSIDCWGPEQEYVRYGLDLDVWKKNFEYVVGQEWITLNINQTLSVLTIKTIPALLDYVNTFNDQREIGHYMSTTVMTYEFLHPSVMGPNFFDDDFNEIVKRMKAVTWQQKNAKDYMQGIISQIRTQHRNQQLIDQLAVFLNEIDQRRSLDWQSTFPWLAKEVTNVLQ